MTLHRYTQSCYYSDSTGKASVHMNTACNSLCCDCRYTVQTTNITLQMCCCSTQVLSDTSDTLERWLKVQMMWCSLESVFTGGDIAKQMPLEAKKFAKVS
jgi:Dynein heavy chain, N-terminal region 2